MFKKYEKYLGVVNGVLYYCVNFHNKMHYILSLVKITKFHKKTKPSFQHELQNLNLSTLLSPKYNIF
jgi:hypothetical protein